MWYKRASIQAVCPVQQVRGYHAGRPSTGVEVRSSYITWSQHFPGFRFHGYLECPLGEWRTSLNRAYSFAAGPPIQNIFHGTTPNFVTIYTFNCNWQNKLIVNALFFKNHVNSDRKKLQKKFGQCTSTKLAQIQH